MCKEEPPVCFDVRIVYEDAQFMIVDKPADLPVHPAGKYCTHTMLAWLHATYPSQPVFHMISRLDRETSGLVLIAKDPITAKRLQYAKKEKIYHVLIEGETFPRDPFYCSGTLARAPEAHVHKRLVLQTPLCAPEQLPIPAGKFGAETHFQYLGPGPWQGTSEIRATLLTGRTHQIRASLKTLGFPVVGDKIYGLDEDYFLRFIEDKLTEVDRALLRLPAQALWAKQLSFEGQTFQSERCPWKLSQ